MLILFISGGGSCSYYYCHCPWHFPFVFPKSRNPANYDSNEIRVFLMKWIIPSQDVYMCISLVLRYKESYLCYTIRRYHAALIQYNCWQLQRCYSLIFIFPYPKWYWLWVLMWMLGLKISKEKRLQRQIGKENIVSWLNTIDGNGSLENSVN